MDTENCGKEQVRDSTQRVKYSTEEHKGARPKSGKVLKRKNTPAVLPTVTPLSRTCAQLPCCCVLVSLRALSVNTVTYVYSRLPHRVFFTARKQCISVFSPVFVCVCVCVCVCSSIRAGFRDKQLCTFWSRKNRVFCSTASFQGVET